MITYKVNYGEIGRRIARTRKSKGLKQTEVCEKCGISDKYLSNIERARSIPSIEVLMSICHALEITPDQLLVGATSRNQQNSYDVANELITLLGEKELDLAENFLRWLVEQRR